MKMKNTIKTAMALVICLMLVSVSGQSAIEGSCPTASAVQEAADDFAKEVAKQPVEKRAEFVKRALESEDNKLAATVFVKREQDRAKLKDSIKKFFDDRQITTDEIKLDKLIEIKNSGKCSKDCATVIDNMIGEVEQELISKGKLGTIRPENIRERVEVNVRLIKQREKEFKEFMDSDYAIGQSFIDKDHWEMALKGLDPDGNPAPYLKKQPWLAYGNEDFTKYKEAYSFGLSPDKITGETKVITRDLVNDIGKKLTGKRVEPIRTFDDAMGSDALIDDVTIFNIEFGSERAKLLSKLKKGEDLAEEEKILSFRLKEGKEISEDELNNLVIKKYLNDIGYKQTLVKKDPLSRGFSYRKEGGLFEDDITFFDENNIERLKQTQKEMMEDLGIASEDAPYRITNLGEDWDELANNIQPKVLGADVVSEDIISGTHFKNMELVSDYLFSEGKIAAIVDYRKEGVARNLNKLIDWTDKRLAEGADPVEVASKFQRYFVSIHPYEDFNGRASRLLMNKILIENGYPPAILEGAVSRTDVFMPVIDYIDEIMKGMDASTDSFIQTAI